MFLIIVVISPIDSLYSNTIRLNIVRKRQEILKPDQRRFPSATFRMMYWLRDRMRFHFYFFPTMCFNLKIQLSPSRTR